MEDSIINLDIDRICDLYELHVNGIKPIYDYIATIPAFPSNTDPVETVAVHTSFQGWSTGHFHALVDMARELKGFGYKVVLFLDGYPPAEELPDDLEICVLPPFDETRDSCLWRFRATETACQKYHVDAVILNDYAPANKYFDYLAIKRVSPERPIRCILQFHSVFCRLQFIIIGNSWLEDNSKAIGAFDALLTESDVDKYFWQTYNQASFFRPLPIMHSVEDAVQSDLSSRNIVYLARLDGTKNQIEAINVMADVVRMVPDAKLVLAGDGDERYIAKLKNLVEELRIPHAVVFAGYLRGEQKEDLLKHAACMISTSRFEGFPLSLAEGKSRGLPLVMYDIPQLTIVEGGADNGTIVVAQRDRKAMARELVRILEDDEYRRDLGKRAHDHMVSIYQFDYKAFWETVFSNPCKADETGVNETQRRIYQTIYNAFANNHIILQEERERSESVLAETKGLLESARNEITRMKSELRAIQSGIIATPVEGESWVDYPVTFRNPYLKKPTVVCSLYSSSKSVEIGNMTASAINISCTGFVIRVFNTGKDKRNPSVSWVAVNVSY